MNASLREKWQRGPLRGPRECQKLNGRDDKIRTCDLTHPKGALYQAEPRPDGITRGAAKEGGAGFVPRASGLIVHGMARECPMGGRGATAH